MIQQRVGLRAGREREGCLPARRAWQIESGRGALSLPLGILFTIRTYPSWLVDLTLIDVRTVRTVLCSRRLAGFALQVVASIAPGQSSPP